MSELYPELDEIRARGVSSVDELTDEDLIKIYNLYATGKLSLKKIAELLGFPHEYNKLRRKINELKSVFIGIVDEQRKGGKLPSLPQISSPETSVDREITLSITREATERVRAMLAVGKAVTETLLTDVVSRDPRLAKMLKEDPSTAILRYVQEAIDLYIKWPDIKAQIDYIVSKYESIIRKLYNFIRYLLPRATPFVRYEVEMKLALDLIERMIIMRILGIKLPTKLPQIIKYYSDIKFLEALEKWEKKEKEAPLHNY